MTLYHIIAFSKKYLYTFLLLAQEFKALMSQSGEMRSKLESAVRTSQQAQQRAKVETSTARSLSAQTPSIKLKTDFSNFTS